jgi:bifunctional oligoribonuclease and PAP phosphatase NrnA
VLDLSKYSKELSKLFEISGNILLVCHINPDGDAIGSQLAIYHYLKSKGKNVVMISPNNLQEFLKWMDGSDQIDIFIRDRQKCKKQIEEADLIIMLDFNQPDRLGEAESLIKSSSVPKIIIDHHPNPVDFAGLIISDPSKCATSELVNELISEIEGKQFVNKSYSEAIYVGIITDTGNFEHGSYTGKTLRIIADIIDTGIEKKKILNLIYNNFSADRMMLLGYALNEKMVVMHKYKTAYIFLSKDDLNKYQHVKGDTEGFVNLPLSISGIEFSVLFVEKEKFVKLSFRSKGNFPTNEFAAKYFFGGGHLNASGGEYPASLEQTIAYFLKVLKDNYQQFENQI